MLLLPCFHWYVNPAVATVRTTFCPLQNVVGPPAVIVACEAVGAEFTVTVIELEGVMPQLLLTSHE